MHCPTSAAVADAGAGAAGAAGAAAEVQPAEARESLSVKESLFLGRMIWKQRQLQRELREGLWLLLECTDTAALEELVFGCCCACIPAPSKPQRVKGSEEASSAAAAATTTSAACPLCCSRTVYRQLVAAADAANSPFFASACCFSPLAAAALQQAANGAWSGPLPSSTLYCTSLRGV